MLQPTGMLIHCCAGIAGLAASQQKSAQPARLRLPARLQRDSASLRHLQKPGGSPTATLPAGQEGCSARCQMAP